MVLRKGMALVGTGIAVGLLVAALVMKPLSKLLLEVSSTDPITFATVPLLLSAVAIFACYIPARRAAKLDPMTALRHE